MRLLILMVLFVQASLQAFAATNVVVHVGTNAIKIATPAGYTELGANLRKHFPANSPNALLAWFAPADLISPGMPPFLTRHAQAQTMKDWTNKNMSDDSFAKFIELTVKQKGEPTDAIAENVSKLFPTNS